MMMNLNANNIEQIVKSLTGSEPEIFEYLPYLMQDLWFLGFNEEKIAELIDKNLPNPSSLNILDLCCGKGALLISLAKKYNCICTGVDLYDKFIDDAKEVSTKENVQNLCSFFTMDIKDAVKNFSGFDIVVYGDDTDTLGTRIESLKAIKKCIKKDGFIILETVFASFDEMNLHVNESRLEIVDKRFWEKEKVKEFNRINNIKIRKRAEELMNKYHDKKVFFEDYVKAQQNESDQIENDFISVTLLLKKSE